MAGLSRTTQAAAQLSDQLEQKSAYHINSAKQGLGELGQFGIDTLAAGTQLASALAANRIVPGGAILLNGMNEFGSETKNARQKGDDLGQQLAAGVGNAALSLGTEKIFNVAPSLKNTYGEGLLDSPLANALEEVYKSSVGRMGISALTEGGEEFAEALAQPILRRILYDPDAEIDLGDAFYQGFVGATVGGLADSMDVVISPAADAAFLSGFLGEDVVQNRDNILVSDYEINQIVFPDNPRKNDLFLLDVEYGENITPDTFTGTDDMNIIKSINGARITDIYDPVAEAHADRYYGLVRSMSTDVSKIAKNTGYSEEFIQQIKNYIFIDTYDLGDASPRRFDPSFAMAQSWQRLISGTPEPHDLTLLKHEEYERELMSTGMSQYLAHIEASKKYNYAKESDAYYAALKKYKDRK